MRQGLYTSGLLHISAGFLLITNFHSIEKKPDELPNNVNVKLLSQTELMKITKLKSTESLEIENSVSELVFNSDSYPKKPEIVSEKKVGNELKGLSEPDIIKIKKRKTSQEIITDRAQRGENERERVEERENKSLNKPEILEKTNKEESMRKNTSSKISSEGKNVAIVTGALKLAKLPLEKPKVFEKAIEDKLNKSSPKKNTADVYNDLVEQVLKVEKQANKMESPLENIAKARILQMLNDNWNVVSINRLPNYEKYVIILELKIDENGNISGPIKVVYPEKVVGNFIIAKRSAIKAVLESTPFPVPKESFPKGLNLRVVFDPETNVGVNNG